MFAAAVVVTRGWFQLLWKLQLLCLDAAFTVAVLTVTVTAVFLSSCSCQNCLSVLSAAAVAAAVVTRGWFKLLWQQLQLLWLLGIQYLQLLLWLLRQLLL
jgi:hypothetical protein